jgi:hypothetical protein
VIRAIQSLRDDLTDRGGSIVATSSSVPALHVSIYNGRIWRAEIDGEPPPTLRVAPGIRTEAIAALKDGGIDSLGPTSVRAIDSAHRDAIVDTIARAAPTLEGTVWDYRPTSEPPRMRRLRGHHISAIIAALRERGIDIMESKLEKTLESQRSVVPECVAVGVVDLEEGVLIAYKTTKPHPQEIIDLLGAQTKDLFCGPVVRQIEAMFRQSRGDTSTAPMFKLFTAETDNFLHVWRRGDRYPTLAFVFVCRATANIGMVKVQSKIAAAEIERARTMGG